MEARRWALLFALYGAVAVPALAVAMPPFQAADEAAQLDRADQVSRGMVLARRLPAESSSGGSAHRGFAVVDGALGFLRGNRAARVPPGLLKELRGVGIGELGEAAFPNTAAYPPIFYLPDAAGILIGTWSGAGAIGVLELARLLNGACALLLGIWAIMLGRELAPALFFGLSLPMSLGSFASASQDGPMIAATALLAAMLATLREAPPGGRRCGMVAGAAALAAFLGMARPPYAALALLLPVAAGMRRREVWWGCGAALGAAGAWAAMVGHAVMARSVMAASAAQAAMLWRHPGWLPVLVVDTVLEQLRHGLSWGREMVGVLGWLDVVLPRPVYLLAVPVGVAAFLRGRPGAGSALLGWRRGAVALLLSVAAAGVLISIYLSWTPLGARTITGVQGRYFLPLLLLSTLALPERGDGGWEGPTGGGRGVTGWRGLADVTVAAFPAIAIAASLRAVAMRYFGG